MRASSSTSGSEVAPGYRRFVSVFAATLGVLLTVSASFLLAIDPEGGHEPWSYDALHAYRDIGNRRGRAHLLLERQWDSVVIGSSRVSLAFDTEQDGAQLGSMANVGLMDTNLWELLRVAEFAVDRAQVRTVLLCVDLHCLAAARRDGADFARSGFVPAAEARLMPDFEAEAAELLSFREMNLAIQCLQRSRRDQRKFGAHGVDLRALPANHRYRDDSAQHLLRVYLANPGTYLGFEYSTERLHDLDGFLAHAEAVGTRVVLLIPPMHALQMECMTQIGLWTEFLRMKGDLTDLAERHRVPLLDFAAHHGFAVERMPQDQESGATMRWWLDCSHATRDLGRLVLDRVERLLAGGEDATDLFGAQLRSGTLALHLRRCDAERDLWRTAHPEEITWVRGVVEGDALRRLLPPGRVRPGIRVGSEHR